MLEVHEYSLTGENDINYFLGGDGTFHFKVLVPSVAAGAIIGKGGETIAQLQKETGARVKMSKSHDFYPGIHHYMLYVNPQLQFDTDHNNLDTVICRISWINLFD